MEKVINIENSIDMRNVFGSNDENISIIEDAFSVGFSLSAKILVEAISKSEKLYIN